MTLSGSTALITGSSRGIGRAIAIEFAKQGCNIVLNYAHNEEAASETEEKLRKLGVEVLKVKADISDHSQTDDMVQQAIEKFGRVNILVNNAGIVKPQLLSKMSREEWQKVLDINLGGTFNCCRALINHMIESGGGRIINIASLFGQTGSFGQCNYAASKWGVIGFTKSLALEVAKHDIIVNAIAPGAIDTDMTKGNEKFLEEFIDDTPLKRLGRPEEIAKIALFLVSDATYTTGDVISANGGFRT
ncbi:3-oxoacyl-ACP reductase family protein [Nanoarchaeota archaeon]